MKWVISLPSVQQHGKWGQTLISNIDNRGFLKKLLSVSRFSVTAKDINNWAAIGHGEVNVEQQGDDSVIWRERGNWDNSLNYLEFSNAYRWTKMEDNAFQLEHMRYGDDNPVMLVSIKQFDDHNYKAMKPHNCDQDVYFLDVIVESDQLILHWRIKGPNKDQHSIILYS